MGYNTISNIIFYKSTKLKFFAVMSFKCNISHIECIIRF